MPAPSDRTRLDRLAARQDERRARLRSVALGLLDAEGLPALSVAAIAGAANLSKPSFYTWYPALGDLLADLADAVASEEAAAVGAAIAAAADGPAAAAALVNGRLAQLPPARFQLLWRWPDTLPATAAVALHHSVRAPRRALLEDALARRLGPAAPDGLPALVWAWSQDRLAARDMGEAPAPPLSLALRALLGAAG
jgi:AcrR family transcriptional regulator